MRFSSSMLSTRPMRLRGKARRHSTDWLWNHSAWSPLNAGILVLGSPILFDAIFTGHEGPIWQKLFVAALVAAPSLVLGMTIHVCWHLTYDPHSDQSP